MPRRAAQTPLIVWSDAALLDAFGSSTKLAAALSSAGYGAPSPALAAKWYSRRTIPAEWRALVTYLALRDKRVSFNSLLTVKARAA